jgi:AraC-like DNA-binding protein
MEKNEQNNNNFRIPVPEEFKDVFSHFYFAKNDTDKPLSKTLIPTYQTIMIFSFGASVYLTSAKNTEIEIDKCIVLGPVKQAFNYLLPVGSEILVVSFKADAFYRFFGKIISNAQDPVKPDELIEENCFTDLWCKLKKMDLAPERVEYILEMSKTYLKSRNPSFVELANFNDDVLNPIKAVANKTNKSERAIQLDHKKYLGYSAKEVNRYKRFIKAVELIKKYISKTYKVDWFEIINECGYYDQSQFIHDFKHYVNLSPNQFLKFQQDICYGNNE